MTEHGYGEESAYRHDHDVGASQIQTDHAYRRENEHAGTVLAG